MPTLTPIADISDANPAAVAHALTGLRAWHHVTQSQADAILRNLLPLLPCDVTIAMRSPRSIVYVTAGAARFRIARMGHLNPKPWNPNPRKPPQNPWAD